MRGLWRGQSTSRLNLTETGLGLSGPDCALDEAETGMTYPSLRFTSTCLCTVRQSVECDLHMRAVQVAWRCGKYSRSLRRRLVGVCWAASGENVISLRARRDQGLREGVSRWLGNSIMIRRWGETLCWQCNDGNLHEPHTSQTRFCPILPTLLPRAWNTILFSSSLNCT